MQTGTRLLRKFIVRVLREELAIVFLRRRMIVQIVLLDLRFLQQGPLPQRAARIFAPQEFPLRHRVAQKRRVVKTMALAGEQLSHRRNAASSIRRARIAMVNDSVGIERPFVIFVRSRRRRLRIQTPLDRLCMFESIYASAM